MHHRQRSLHGITSVVLAAVVAGHAWRPAWSQTTAHDVAAYYLVFEVGKSGKLDLVHRSTVQMRGPLVSIPAGQMQQRLATVERDREHIGVTVRDRFGAVAYQNTVSASQWLRGEFQVDAEPGESNIDGHFLPMQSTAIVVRVPVIAGGQLTLEPGVSSRLAPSTVDLDALAAAPNALQPSVVAQPPPLPGWSNGDPANRFDLLIMGDGYTAAQAAQFQSDAQQVADNFFGITPYQDYRNYVNVSALFVASTDAGADQPPYDSTCTQYSRLQTCCGDASASGKASSFVNTAFDASFCSFNIERLVTVNASKVLAAAAAEPNWDAIMVLVNDPTYGGSGGSMSVISTHSSAVLIAQHEFGHSFTKLADEYSTPYPGFPPCSDISSPHCEPNVTDQTARAQIKWARWIAASTPIPSSGPLPQETAAGLWQGARYLSTGMYRQGYSCLMRFLGTPFCDVASEAFALRLYAGGWGIPSAGIDTIEPGSESPPPGTLSVSVPGSTTLSATVLGPIAGPAVTVDWRVDGLLVSTSSHLSGDAVSYDFVDLPGTHTVTLDVGDNSPIIHPTQRAGVAGSRTWTLTAPGSAPTHDTVILPVKPINAMIPRGKTRITKTLRVRLRNADGGETAGHSVSLAVDDSDCGGSVAGVPDLVPSTPGTDPAVLIPGGQVRLAAVPLTLSSAAFTSFNRKAPRRCTLWLTAGAAGAVDPTISNNTFPVELNVIDMNDPIGTAVHESTVRSLPPLSVKILRGRSTGTKTAKPRLGNADANEPLGHVVGAVAADGSCPPGTLGMIDHDGRATGIQDSITVRGGAAKTVILPVTLNAGGAGGITTPNNLSPYRCIATVTVSGSAGDSDATNNTTQLVIDAADANDLPASQ